MLMIMNNLDPRVAQVSLSLILIILMTNKFIKIVIPVDRYDIFYHKLLIMLESNHSSS